MKQKFDLENHKVLVTGAASGIGLATVKAFLENGASVAINDLPGEKLDTVLDELTSKGARLLPRPGISETPIQLAIWSIRPFRASAV